MSDKLTQVTASMSNGRTVLFTVRESCAVATEAIHSSLADGANKYLRFDIVPNGVVILSIKDIQGVEIVEVPA